MEKTDKKTEFKTLNVGCGKDIWGDVRVDVSYHFYDFWECRPTILADAHCLPFQTQTFDVVKAKHVLEHLVSPYVALNEICRVARKQIILEFPAENDVLALMISLLFDYPPQLKIILALLKERLNGEHKWVIPPQDVVRFLEEKGWHTTVGTSDVPIFRALKYGRLRKYFQPLTERIRMKEFYRIISKKLSVV